MNKNSDRRASIANPCENSKVEGLWGDSEPV